MYAAFRSIGSYLPEKVLTNHELAMRVDTSDEWITKRTGIKERRVASDDEASSDLGYKAALQAIGRTDIAIDEIDMVICATLSPDYLTMPSTATMISKKLGIKNVMAFDISAACTGFIYLISLAKAFIESGAKRNILIVGAEKTSSVMDYEDRSVCILFGDGAGAAIVGQTFEKNEAIIDVLASADGSYGDLLITPGCGSKNPIREDNVNQKLQYMQMSGNEVFKVAIKTLTSNVIEILKKNKIDASEVDMFIPHQANYRIIEAVRAKLNFPLEKTALTVAKHGNTSSASIPMAMNEMYESGRIKYGDLMLLDAFGGGFTWGSALVKFAGKNFST